MSEVPYVLLPNSSPPRFSDEDKSDDEEVSIRSKRALVNRKKAARNKEKKKKGSATWVKPIEGLSAGITLESIQQDKQDAMDIHQASTLYIASTYYVIMAYVGVSYKDMNPVHVVMGPGSGYNVILRYVLPIEWKRYVIRNAKLPSVGDAEGNPL